MSPTPGPQASRSAAAPRTCLWGAQCCPHTQHTRGPASPEASVPHQGGSVGCPTFRAQWRQGAGCRVPGPHVPLGGPDCPLPGVSAGSRRPVPALCARGLLASPEWQGPTAGGWRRGEGCGPGSQPPGGHCWQPEQRPSVGPGLALGMAGAEATPSEPGGRRQCWVPDTWDRLLAAFRETGAQGPVLWAAQASPCTSPGLRALRCPPTARALRAAPSWSPGQGSGLCQRQRHPGHGTSPLPCSGAWLSWGSWK